MFSCRSRLQKRASLSLNAASVMSTTVSPNDRKLLRRKTSFFIQAIDDKYKLMFTVSMGRVSYFAQMFCCAIIILQHINNFVFAMFQSEYIITSQHSKYNNYMKFES